ncbi:hypothetical protein P168DRAFT_319458 [Aspergillus campestris IBT 28561]|uniref:Hepatocellular carcinoma-associated antigen 59-domain-containing protein n=1 Tax=Aspergillus campestris (strain IBT 28561) TaxID=1392248 RepID=A0A2I1CZ67_ASPC2|nr:uncharacterized protein P168DRAFT_319458 [Aspergillus campestris IBT 28561]PKY02915.1 hypothetical protein P168DRAFT_319458 [Aspergillus campestris IBT 28561]
METQEPFFRPIKKRKFLRRRPEQTQETRSPSEDREHSTNTPPVESAGEADDGVQTSDVVRLRRQHRARKGGIEFSTTSRKTANNGGQGQMTTGEELEDERIRHMGDRFTAHTGQTVDVDKHMMAYIESEMAKRFQHNLPADKLDSDTRAPNDRHAPAPSLNLPQRQPASLGKLHEIDLGQETKLQNIARTEAATRHFATDEGQPQYTEVAGPSRDAAGKSEQPWRNRKRRTSEDIERDRLVEEILRESKLDVYDEPEEEKEEGEDQAADDKVAEQFRRDFLDAIQSRRRAKKKKPTTTTAAAKPEPPKGPKLGGSRSARAAMREMQEKTARK